MSLPAVALDVVNLALLQLYQGVLTTLTDPTDPAAQPGLLIYDQCRVSTIRNFDWNFARTRGTATLVTGKVPPFDFDTFYQMPANSLRLLWVGNDYTRHFPINYDIQGDLILVNQSDLGATTVTTPISLTPTAITNANPGIVTVPSTAGMVAGMQIFISGIGGMINLSGYYIAQNITPTTFTLYSLSGVPLDTTSFAAFTSGGTIVGTAVMSPATSINIKYAQDVQDPTQWDPLFMDAIALEMACRLCMPITGSRTLLADLRIEQKAQLAEALAINHQEKPVIVTEDDYVGQARWLGGDYTGSQLNINPNVW